LTGASQAAQDQLSVIEQISPRDQMYGGEPTHYLRVGRSAVGFVGLALRAAAQRPPGRILDLPCGHGRVLRFLKARFPDAELVACDINRDGVDFCAETFGARPVYSVESPREIDLHGEFDLIWCGSLLTHLDADGWTGFLDLFESLLSPRGLAVFTTNGPFTRDLLWLAAQTPTTVTDDNRPLPESDPAYWPRRAREYFDLSDDSKEQMLSDYAETGFGYADYPDSDSYGLSVASPAWVCRQLERLPELKLVTYVEHGWDKTQDVVACGRRERPFPVDG
jgi:SAM-dependent methyltransferase